MKKSDFYFDLPERLIAQHPLEQRDASRLMVLDRRDGSVTHRHFRDLLEYVHAGFASRYAEELVIQVERGVVKGQQLQDNRTEGERK